MNGGNGGGGSGGGAGGGGAGGGSSGGSGSGSGGGGGGTSGRSSTAARDSRRQTRVIRTGRDRGSGLLGSQPQPVIPASVIPEELITQVQPCLWLSSLVLLLCALVWRTKGSFWYLCFHLQAQVVLQGKSRSVIIRELQRTNLDVNLAVNNLLSRDDEDGDDGDDTASESYLPGGLSKKQRRLHNHPGLVLSRACWMIFFTFSCPFLLSFPPSRRPDVAAGCRHPLGSS